MPLTYRSRKKQEHYVELMMDICYDRYRGKQYKEPGTMFCRTYKHFLACCASGPRYRTRVGGTISVLIVRGETLRYETTDIVGHEE